MLRRAVLCGVGRRGAWHLGGRPEMGSPAQVDDPGGGVILTPLGQLWPASPGFDGFGPVISLKNCLGFRE